MEAVTFSVSEAVSTESSVRLSAEDDDSSESSSAGWGSTGQSVGKPKIRTPGTLLVTTRLRSVVKRIKVLGLVDGRLPPATHPFVFRGQEMDLEGAPWTRLPGG